MFGAVAKELFNLFQMNVLWRTYCNMYKREISILCSFFFPTLYLWGWGPKTVVYTWGGHQEYSLSGENIDTRVSSYLFCP